MSFKINNKTIKGVLIGTVLGGIIFGGIGVAAVTLSADQIQYTPSDENFSVSNAKQAIDELYKISEYSSVKTWEDFVEIAGYNSSDYDTFETFIKSSEYNTAVTSNDAIDALYSNEMMFVYLLRYPDQVVSLLNNPYAVDQIKLHENLCKQLIKTEEVVEKLYASCVNVKSTVITTEEYTLVNGTDTKIESRETDSDTVTINGLVLGISSWAHSQVGLYWDTTGGSCTMIDAYLNNTKLSSVRADTYPPGGGSTYCAVANETTAYNTSMYSLENTVYLHRIHTSIAARALAKGGATVYYL